MPSPSPFRKLLRWRLIEQWTGGVQGLYIDLPEAPPVFSATTAGASSCTRPAALGLWLAANVIASRSGVP